MFSRTDRSLLGVWWWTCDRTMLFLAFLLLVGGMLMVMAASPPVATRLGFEETHFVLRHGLFAITAFFVMLAVSMLNDSMVRVIGIFGLLALLVLIGLVLVFGSEANGARRWLSIAGFGIQPSEFAKPCFAITTAWLLSMWRVEPGFHGWLYALLVLAVIAGMLLAQPDIGMTIIFVMTWAVLMFLAGLPKGQVATLTLSAPALAYVAYNVFPHVTLRVDQFLSGGNSQSAIARASFSEGGWLGVGLANGEVKKTLPDAHADFIFAVVGEEYGGLIAVMVLAIYAYMALRALHFAQLATSLFRMLAISGLAVQFGLQVAIHTASAVQLIPTKGMTLPFISYGGSSMLATSMTLGFIIALTRPTKHDQQGHSGSLPIHDRRRVSV
ncbi:MAG: putative lipid II flippase FtsW [Proteobacteria bacterium]|nr:putative lipid II flippase FtsW [Pseudomonadota bacterium]